MSTAALRCCEPVGRKEIAARLGRPEATVQQWRTRGVFPAPEPTTVGGRPWWRWDVIEQWARETGRLAGQLSGRVAHREPR